VDPTPSSGEGMIRVRELDRLLYLPPRPVPDPPGRALAKAALRALLWGVPLGACLAFLSVPLAIAFACAAWILFPLALAGGRLPPRAVLALGALLGALQLAGLWLQGVYLEGVFEGLPRGAALSRIYKLIDSTGQQVVANPGPYVSLAAAGLLWGIAIGAGHAALSEPESHLRGGRLSLSEVAVRLLQVPALIVLPTLGSLAGATTFALIGSDALELATFVGIGVCLLGAGFLFMATHLVAFALVLSSALERRVLGRDPAPRRPPPPLLEPSGPPAALPEPQSAAPPEPDPPVRDHSLLRRTRGEES
jgi:hypothetical protein